MRKIKFRAFCHSKVRDVFEIRFIDGGIEICVEDDSGLPFYTTKFISLSQYTGLKDKNGKEIYEGDILHIKSPDETNLNYEESVTFHDGCFFPVCEYCEKDKMYEIIGNIYENPELVKGNNGKD